MKMPIAALPLAMPALAREKTLMRADIGNTDLKAE
jgi:hypothetical protein